MKTKLLAAAALLIGSTSLFAGPRIAIGVGIGAPAYPYSYYRPAPVYVAPPVAYGPGYGFVGGYWGPGHVWHRYEGPRYRNDFHRGEFRGGWRR